MHGGWEKVWGRGSKFKIPPVPYHLLPIPTHILLVPSSFSEVRDKTQCMDQICKCIYGQVTCTFCGSMMLIRTVSKSSWGTDSPSWIIGHITSNIKFWILLVWFSLKQGKRICVGTNEKLIWLGCISVALRLLHESNLVPCLWTFIIIIMMSVYDLFKSKY